MRKIICISTIIALLIILAVPMKVNAENISDDFNDILYNSDVDMTFDEGQDLDISAIFEKVKESLADRLVAPIKMLGILLTVILLSTVLKMTGNDLKGSTNSDIFSLVCVLAVSSAVMPRLAEVYERAFRTVISTGGFISVFVPAFAGLTAAMGGIGSAGVYNLMILGASELILSAADNWFMPTVSAVSAISAAGAIFSDGSLDKLSALIKKALIWTMTAAVTLFTGFVSLKCTLEGKADGVATKTLKFAVSGFIPIAGGAVTDAYSTVRSSFDVIRCTAGTVGTVALVLIMLPPILEIAVYRLVMWIGAAVGEMFSAEAVTKLLSTLDCGLAIAQSVLVCYSLIFVLCTGILMNCVS